MPPIDVFIDVSSGAARTLTHERCIQYLYALFFHAIP